MNPNGRKVQIFLELRHTYQSGNKLRISNNNNKQRFELRSFTESWTTTQKSQMCVETVNSICISWNKPNRKRHMIVRLDINFDLFTQFHVWTDAKAIV